MNPVVFYDGACSFCNYWVQWILKHDEKRVFLFASLQSDFATNVFDNYNYSPPRNTLIVLSGNGCFLHRSQAIKYILNKLNIRNGLAVLLHLTPPKIAHVGYRAVSFFRKQIPVKACEIPSKEHRHRFLDDTNADLWCNSDKKADSFYRNK